MQIPYMQYPQQMSYQMPQQYVTYQALSPMQNALTNSPVRPTAAQNAQMVQLANMQMLVGGLQQVPGPSTPLQAPAMQPMSLSPLTTHVVNSHGTPVMGCASVASATSSPVQAFRSPGVSMVQQRSFMVSPPLSVATGTPVADASRTTQSPQVKASRKMLGEPEDAHIISWSNEKPIADLQKQCVQITGAPVDVIERFVGKEILYFRGTLTTEQRYQLRAKPRSFRKEIRNSRVLILTIKGKLTLTLAEGLSIVMSSPLRSSLPSIELVAVNPKKFVSPHGAGNKDSIVHVYVQFVSEQLAREHINTVDAMLYEGYYVHSPQVDEHQVFYPNDNFPIEDHVWENPECAFTQEGEAAVPAAPAAPTFSLDDAPTTATATLCSALTQAPALSAEFDDIPQLADEEEESWLRSVGAVVNEVHAPAASPSGSSASEERESLLLKEMKQASWKEKEAERRLEQGPCATEGQAKSVAPEAAPMSWEIPYVASNDRYMNAFGASSVNSRGQAGTPDSTPVCGEACPSLFADNVINPDAAAAPAKQVAKTGTEKWGAAASSPAAESVANAGSSSRLAGWTM